VGALDHRNVRAVLEGGAALGIAVVPVEFPDGTRTAEDAAAAIGVAVGQIVKSMVFLVDDQPVVALVSGSNRVDEAKLAAAAGGTAATRPDAKVVRAATGFPIGGVAPFGYPAPLPTYVDEDLVAHGEVWAACGMPHVNFAVASADLVRATGAVVADIAARA
jgi:prolyl-tRNA editing enzyme YbaK/EbsC (Cys-tRNA(Pro) deacylase)